MIAREFAAERKRLKVSQGEAARELGLTPSDVSAVERHGLEVPDAWLTAVRAVASRRLAEVVTP